MSEQAPLWPETTPDTALAQAPPQAPVSRPSRLVREPLRRSALGVDPKASARDPRVPCDACGKRPADVIVGAHLEPFARWLCWQCHGRRRDHLPVIGTIHRARAETMESAQSLRWLEPSPGRPRDGAGALLIGVADEEPTEA